MKHILVKKNTGMMKISQYGSQVASIFVSIFHICGKIKCFIAVHLNLLNLFHLNLTHVMYSKHCETHSDEKFG